MKTRTGPAPGGQVALLAAGLALAALHGCGGASAAPTAPAATAVSPSSTAVSSPGVVLGRPTGSSMVVSVRADAGTQVYLEYGATPGTYTGQSASVTVPAGGPVAVALSGLAPDTPYRYRLRYRAATESSWRADVERSFHTARLPGHGFRFVVEADPHLDGNSSAAVYTQTLANQLADAPDLMFDLGDTSMVEKCAVDGSNQCASPAPATQSTVAARYALIRSYLEQTAHSVPLFMVLGNHDGETGWVDTAAPALDTWAATARKAYFPNPEPDSFYTGSADPVAGIGLRQSWYAFEWGDALFVVLDPYTFTTQKPGQNGWGWTLGAAQYQWLASTLQGSRARFRFVFSHHLLGGNGTDARGGAAFARFFEWGGHNLDGSWGFASQRPGWPAPIHQLLVDGHVTAWFHGHDHLYAQEELDGVVYQEVPQPSLARYDTPNPGAGYGYQGTGGVNIFPSSGHLRVTVGAADVRVEYVRSVALADETATRRNGAIVTSYVVR